MKLNSEGSRMAVAFASLIEGETERNGITRHINPSHSLFIRLFTRSIILFAGSYFDVNRWPVLSRRRSRQSFPPPRGIKR